MFLVAAGFLLTWMLMILILTLVQGVLTGSGESSALQKRQRRNKRNVSALWTLVLIAIAYGGVIRYLHTLTGSAVLDGSIGLALGLYLCSHPAANAVDVLLFERDTMSRISEWPVVRWLALNLLVLLTGRMVVFIGLRRLVDMPV
jgi:TRAP-type C4-dicarboxylate transport system permease large subunit